MSRDQLLIVLATMITSGRPWADKRRAARASTFLKFQQICILKTTNEASSLAFTVTSEKHKHDRFVVLRREYTKNSRISEFLSTDLSVYSIK